MSSKFQAVTEWLSKYLRRGRKKQEGVEFFEPNYLYLDAFHPRSIIVDVGCGHAAELSEHLIGRYNLRAYGVDPTRKHKRFLKALEAKFDGKFVYVPVAVSNSVGQLTFSESNENESGSLLEDHTNVRTDSISRYSVEALSIRGLMNRIRHRSLDYLKLDLEGSEYDLLESVSVEDLRPIKQLFVEFHHHCVASRTKADTKSVVKRLESLGMNYHTVDDRDFLFYWPKNDD